MLNYIEEKYLKKRDQREKKKLNKKLKQMREIKYLVFKHK